GYTLLRLDAAVDVAPLVQAAQQRGVPLTVLDLAGLPLPDAYRHQLVLCRQDQHVAWRGDRLPHNPTDLVDQFRGARSMAP
ncbi:MAG: monooxygenase, partial [Rubrivivax sp.]